MKVIIRTEWPEVVAAIWHMFSFQYRSRRGGELSTIIFECSTDNEYREITLWLGSALACGLILRGEIER